MKAQKYEPLLGLSLVCLVPEECRLHVTSFFFGSLFSGPPSLLYLWFSIWVVFFNAGKPLFFLYTQTWDLSQKIGIAFDNSTFLAIHKLQLSPDPYIFRSKVNCKLRPSSLEICSVLENEHIWSSPLRVICAKESNRTKIVQLCLSVYIALQLYLPRMWVAWKLCLIVSSSFYSMMQLITSLSWTLLQLKWALHYWIYISLISHIHQDRS